MSKSIFSSLWYRVAEVKPQLLNHVHIDRHCYRDQIWYVLHDPVAGRYHRFTPAAHFLICQMKGEKTLQTIWEEAVIHLGDEGPSQDDTIVLLGQLHGSNVLSSDVPPDSLEIFKRHEKQRWQKIKQKLISPLSIKFPLFDPEKMLNRFQYLVKPMFSGLGVLLWLVIVTTAMVQVGIHWSELTENISSTVLTPNNLFLIWLLFPVIKALHELGHAFATKIWGGEVHEMGVMLLVFIPIPYVDASAASAFRERYKRVCVGAAGILVEVFLASLAIFVWLYVEQGIIRAMAYNVILIAGVSTLLFNANPLLRFDGYYILADYLEIPNLGNRANRYLGYLMQKYAFGAKYSKSPVTARGERSWFVFYSIAAYVYRLFITVSIALFVAGQFFFVGILLAALAVFNMFLLPILKGVHFVFKGSQIQAKRFRAVSITSAMIAVGAAFIFLIPLPYWTNAQGVVWLPEQSLVRAEANCFVEQVLGESGAMVEKNQPVVRCRNSHYLSEREVAQAKLDEINVRRIAQWREDPLLAEITLDERKTALAALVRAQERMNDLLIKSPIKGELILPLAQDLQGKFVQKGEHVGYIMHEQPLIVRAVVTQNDIELVRNDTLAVQMLFPHDTNTVVDGTLQREVPSAENWLPSAALGSASGGRIAVDPRKQGGQNTFEKIFQFDIALPQDNNDLPFGGRVHIRFNHRKTTLAQQWYRVVRQLFLDEFNV